MPGEPSDASEHIEDTAWLSDQLRIHPETRKNRCIWSGENTAVDKVVRNLASWDTLAPLILRGVSSLYPQHRWVLSHLLLLDLGDLRGNSQWVEEALTG